MPHVLKLKGRYYYNRRVPEEYQEFDSRKNIRISLQTDSASHAARKAIAFDEQMIAYWQTLAHGKERHCSKRFRRTVRIAKQMGFSYQPMSVVATLPIIDLVERFLALKGASSGQVEAVLGGRSEAGLKWGDALDQYWPLSKDQIFDKSEDQIRKWKNPRIKAVKNFIAIRGNKDILRTTREDILAVRDWWLDRINDENLHPGSANKDLIHLKAMLETLSDAFKLEIDIGHLFKKVMLDEHDHCQTRLPFSLDQIAILFNSQKFSELEAEDRYFLWAAAETGARPSELLGLLPEDIKLDCTVPHIAIKARKKKKLKTRHSERFIPLVGYALEAFQNCPNGFPRFRDKPDVFTTKINKQLRSIDLLPSERHSVYSFRHSFQDRILSVNAPDRVQAELMGHKFNRPKYGDGASLDQKHYWLSKVVLKSDTTLNEKATESSAA